MLKSLLRVSILSCVAAGLAVLYLTFDPTLRDERAKFSSCRDNVTSDCLIALGIEMSMNGKADLRFSREVNLLAQMGRFDEAFALGLRLELANAVPLKEPEVTVNRQLASHRITAAIRRGESAERAYSETPSADPFHLWVSARQLLGHTGTFDVQAPRPDDQTLIAVANMAEMIAMMTQNASDQLRIKHLVRAAELQAELGNRLEAIQLLEQIPDTAIITASLSKELVGLIGSETALGLFPTEWRGRSHLLLTAAAAEPDPARAVEYLDMAYGIYSAEKPWPDFSWMERVVQRSASLGLDDHALLLARDLAEKAQTEPAAFPVFPHIMAARALMTAGAEESEVLQSLNFAESGFPQKNTEVVGFGLVSGPVHWGRSGLNAQARREIANLRARLGDTDVSIRMLEGIEDPVFAWNDILSADIPVEHLSTLLEHTETILSVEDYSYVRAQLSSRIYFFGKAGAPIDWARSTSNNILQEEQLSGDRAVLTYRSIALFGAKIGDTDIQRRALTRMAHAALESRDFGNLIQAGFEWYKFENDPAKLQNR